MTRPRQQWKQSCPGPGLEPTTVLQFFLSSHGERENCGHLIPHREIDTHNSIFSRDHFSSYSTDPTHCILPRNESIARQTNNPPTNHTLRYSVAELLFIHVNTFRIQTEVTQHEYINIQFTLIPTGHNRRMMSPNTSIWCNHAHPHTYSWTSLIRKI